MKKMKTAIMALILALTMTMSIPAEAAGQNEVTDELTASEKKTVMFYKHVYHAQGKYGEVNRFMESEKFLFEELKKYGLEAAEPYVFAFICWDSDLLMSTKTGKGRYIGYFQFDKKYWKEMYRRAGLKKAKITDASAQIRVFCHEYAYYMKKSKSYQEALGRFYTGGKRSKKIEKAINKMFEKKVKVW